MAEPGLELELQNELIDLAKRYEEESQEAYAAIVEPISQCRAMVKGAWGAGDWFDDTQWRWRPVNESPEKDKAPRFNYHINYLKAWWEILQGAIQTVGLPGATFRPQNSGQIQDREAAEKARQIIAYQQTVTDFRDLMLGIFRFFSTDGICLGYVRHVKDPIRYGTSIILTDVVRQQVMQEAGYGCPNCEVFTPQGQTQRLDTGRITCPACRTPLHAKNFMPEQVADVTVQEDQEVPNGREVVNLYGGLESLLPWWANDLGHSHYCRIATEIAVEEAIAGFEKKEAAILAQVSGNGNQDRKARERVRSPLHSGVGIRSRLITYLRWWFRPQCFYGSENKVRRQALLKKFPVGVFFQLLGGESPVFCDAFREAMESKLTLMRPLKGDGMYTPSLLQSGVPLNLAANDAWNMALKAMLFAAFGQGYADEDMFSGKGINATRLEAGNIKTLHVPPDKKLKDSFFEMKSQDVSQSVQNFLQMTQPLAEILIGTERVLSGGPIPNVRTAKGQAQARSQALQRQAPAYGALKTGMADIQEKMVNEFLQNRTAETFFEIVTDAGDFEELKIQLNPVRGRVVAYPEASEAVPQTWAQQQDVNMALLDTQNPVVQAMLADPTNARAFFESLGTNLSVPGKELQEKYERLIEILLEQEPHKEPGNPDPLNPTMPPADVLASSIPFDPIADDANVFLSIYRKWAATPKGMAISQSGSPGYQNLRAYAEEAWAAKNMVMEAATRQATGGPA